MVTPEVATTIRFFDTSTQVSLLSKLKVGTAISYKYLSWQISQTRKYVIDEDGISGSIFTPFVKLEHPIYFF